MSPRLVRILRNVLGVFVGYVTMAALVIGGIAMAWMLVGGGAGAFAGEGPDPSTKWMLMNVLFGFLAALGGGWVARRVGASKGAVYGLIGVLLTFGLIAALFSDRFYAQRPKIDVPVADMTFQEAGQHAKQPAWYNWLIPLVGATGAALGGRGKG